METRIIIVEDDFDCLELLNGKLVAAGYRDIRAEDDSVKAASLFQKGAVFDVALIDMNMPGMDGIALLEFIKNTSPRTECIMVTAVNDARVAVECLKKGAYDYLVKPITQEDLIFSITRSLERKRLLDILDIKEGKSVPRLMNPEPFRPILTRSEKMRRLLKEAELHAVSEVPVLITGESGTGKELLARAIHRASSRARNPFTPVNMASQSATLSRPSFSVTPRARSPERKKTGPAFSWLPTTAPFSWTRSAISPWNSRANFCGCSRTASTRGWEPANVRK